MAQKLSEARNLHGTYQALLKQLAKDEMHAKAQLNAVADTLQHTDRETSKLHDELAAETSRKAAAAAKVQALTEDLGAQRRQHAEQRASMLSTVERLGQEVQQRMLSPACEVWRCLGRALVMPAVLHVLHHIEEHRSAENVHASR